MRAAGEFANQFDKLVIFKPFGCNFDFLVSSPRTAQSKLPVCRANFSFQAIWL
jgi:hypothetical protein